MVVVGGMVVVLMKVAVHGCGGWWYGCGVGWGRWWFVVMFGDSEGSKQWWWWIIWL